MLPALRPRWPNARNASKHWKRRSNGCVRLRVRHYLDTDLQAVCCQAESPNVRFGSWLCQNVLPQRPGWAGVPTRAAFSDFDYTRIAAISGWMPMMFITRVRL